MNRVEKIRQTMKEKEVDAVIVLDELNQRYFSEFAFTDGLLLITKDRAELITDFRYYEMAIKGADKAFSVSMPDNKDAFISEIFASSLVKTAGFEGSWCTECTRMPISLKRACTLASYSS